MSVKNILQPERKVTDTSRWLKEIGAKSDPLVTCREILARQRQLRTLPSTLTKRTDIGYYVDEYLTGALTGQKAAQALADAQALQEASEALMRHGQERGRAMLAAELVKAWPAVRKAADKYLTEQIIVLTTNVRDLPESPNTFDPHSARQAGVHQQWALALDAVENLTRWTALWPESTQEQWLVMVEPEPTAERMYVITQMGAQRFVGSDEDQAKQLSFMRAFQFAHDAGAGRVQEQFLADVARGEYPGLTLSPAASIEEHRNRVARFNACTTPHKATDQWVTENYPREALQQVFLPNSRPLDAA